MNIAARTTLCGMRSAEFPMPDEPHCYCPACCRADSDRLSDLASEHWRVEPFDMPTGAGDADVGWRVYAYHQGKPDVLVAEVFEDDVRAALDAASGIDRDRAMGAKDGQS